MTEQEWMTCTVPQTMLKWLAGRWRRRLSRWCGLAASPSTRRRLWLLAAACCVRSTQGITIPNWDDELRTLVALGQGEIEFEQFESFLNHDRRAWVTTEDWVMWRAESAGKHRALRVAWEAATHEAATTGKECVLDWGKVMPEWTEERKAQSHCLRDIFGNPFRPSPPLPHAVLAWNDSTVTRMAQGIYEDRKMSEGTLDPARLAILADALLDAGCEDEELIRHCRAEGPHVRGCWAVDLILGKE